MIACRASVFKQIISSETRQTRNLAEDFPGSHSKSWIFSQFDYNLLQDFIAKKMLGNMYEFYKDCCGHLQFKMELTKIKLGAGAGGVQQNQTQQYMQAQQAKDPFTFGTWYRNTFVYYCGCCICPSFYGNQVELNNERIVATKEPKCYPWCGPYPVEDKMNAPIGELVPHWYICAQDLFALFGFTKCWYLGYITNFWYCWHPCCAYLQVKNSNMATVYNVNRLPCTCLCCTKWEIQDPVGTKKGEIRQTGFFCPNYEFELPPDHENHRKLLLATISYLP